MWDVLYIAIGLAFFVAGAAYLAACERL